MVTKNAQGQQWTDQVARWRRRQSKSAKGKSANHKTEHDQGHIRKIRKPDPLTKKYAPERICPKFQPCRALPKAAHRQCHEIEQKKFKENESQHINVSGDPASKKGKEQEHAHVWKWAHSHLPSDLNQARECSKPHHQEPTDLQHPPSNAPPVGHLASVFKIINHPTVEAKAAQSSAPPFPTWRLAMSSRRLTKKTSQRMWGSAKTARAGSLVVTMCSDSRRFTSWEAMSTNMNPKLHPGKHLRTMCQFSFRTKIVIEIPHSRLSGMSITW